jgi:hypothetical protein
MLLIERGERFRGEGKQFINKKYKEERERDFIYLFILTCPCT